jgi:hypothetical protein
LHLPTTSSTPSGLSKGNPIYCVQDKWDNRPL